jgi:hypothetical protein
LRPNCSRRFADVFKFLAPGADPRPQERVALWGVEFPQAVASGPREFKQGGADARQR